ncbi:hypothetical protein ACHAXT_012888 [Thalassiosira profunda]
MPPPSGKKKKKGRAPKHQNGFAFRHNPKSKKTDKILSSPNVGVCRRCYEKIEWRKKYRKYKPRTQPGKCNLCSQKNVLAAYHTLCTKCAGSDRAIDAMERKMGGGGGGGASKTEAVAGATPAGEDGATPGNEEAANDEGKVTEGATADATASSTKQTSASKASRRRLRVCAMCAAEPALSKYANASPEDMDIVEQIHELEDTLDSGVHSDGHKLTLREVKGLERKVEKLQGELKERSKKRKEGEDDGGDGEDDAQSGEGDCHDSVKSEGEDVDACNAEEDPFLAATGGKALVGEDYQKVLLAREQQK